MMTAREMFKWWGELEYAGRVPAWACTHYYRRAKDTVIFTKRDTMLDGYTWHCGNPRCSETFGFVKMSQRCLTENSVFALRGGSMFSRYVHDYLCRYHDCQQTPPCEDRACVCKPQTDPKAPHISETKVPPKTYYTTSTTPGTQ